MDDLFVVDPDLDVATAGDIARFESVVGSRLPRSYTGFLESLGEGTYGEFLWVKGVDRVLDDRLHLRELLEGNGDFWWPESEAVLPHAAAIGALPVAVSDDGDYVVLDPATAKLFVLPRHRSTVFEVPSSFDDPLDWPEDYLAGRTSPRIFVPTHNHRSVEMVSRGGVPPLAEQERRLSSILSGRPGDHVRRSSEHFVIIHSRHSRSRLQLSGRVAITYNKDHPDLIMQAVEAAEAMGFVVVDTRR